MRDRVAAFGAAIVAAFLLRAASASAYPIPPVTLWELTEQAELIVVARVARVESASRSSADDAFHRDTARLEVLDVWKGSVRGEVSVAFGKGITCPAPPRYEAGETVVAFLESPTSLLASWGKDLAPEEARQLAAQWRDRWLTIGLSYGTLYARDEDLPFLHELVEEAAVLQAQSPPVESARRAWHVRAAARRATRWQGLHALLRESRRLPSEGEDDLAPPAKPVPATGDQRREVMRGFILEPSGDHTLPMTLAFVGQLEDDAFDRAVLAQLERVLKEDRLCYWLPDALARMVERFGSVNGRRDLKLKPEHEYDEPKAAALRRAWEEARVRFGMPVVAPAPEPPGEEPGVAGLTPD